jgi:DNA-binding transcriptional ArsR family regulator
MNESNLANLGTLFLALSDTTRLKLIGLMADGEVSVGYLAESIGESQPKVSRHLAYLRTAGLVATRRDGKHIFYGLEWPSDDVAGNVMAAVIGSKSAERQNTPVHQKPPVEHDERNTYDVAYVSDYVPQEIEIYLL